jgi:hypothetical protein
MWLAIENTSAGPMMSSSSANGGAKITIRRAPLEFEAIGCI